MPSPAAGVQIISLKVVHELKMALNASHPHLMKILTPAAARCESGKCQRWVYSSSPSSTE